MARMPLTKEQVTPQNLVLKFGKVGLTEEQFSQLCCDNKRFAHGTDGPERVDHHGAEGIPDGLAREYPCGEADELGREGRNGSRLQRGHLI
jgi:hypothetical protein